MSLPHPFRFAGGVAEGVEEQGGDDGAGFGAGRFGAASYLRRPVQQSHNPPLLVQGRQGNRHLLKI